MAMDMFINIDGIKGESVDHKHKDEIDVLSWSWGMSQSASAHQGGGMGSGKVAVRDLSFTKYVDKSTPILMKFCCNGKHIPKATLVVRKAGEKPLEYIKVLMEDIIVAHVSAGGSGGNDRLTEEITLNFARVKYDYTPQDQKGAAAPVQNMGWDIAANKEHG